MTLNGSKVVKFNAQEFLQLSLRLVSYEPNEAGYRTAINRAYYACFLIGRESATRKGWLIPSYRGDDHSGLRRALDKVPNLSDKLLDLYQLREHADYHIDPKQQPPNNSCSYCRNQTEITPLVNEDTWKRAKAIAENILPRLQSLMPS